MYVQGAIAFVVIQPMPIPSSLGFDKTSESILVNEGPESKSVLFHLSMCSINLSFNFSQDSLMTQMLSSSTLDFAT